MDKSRAIVLGEKIMASLKPLEKELGIKISQGNGRFDDNSLSIKITATEPNASGEIETKEMKIFRDNAEYSGFRVSDLGREFEVMGSNRSEKFLITGMTSRGIIIGKKADGKLYRFRDVNMVAKQIEKKYGANRK